MSRKKNSDRILYHIGKSPAKPVPRHKGSFYFSFNPDNKEDGWDRPWLKGIVKNGVFLSNNPLAVCMFHGVYGNVYAYSVSNNIIKKAGGLHRYDMATEILFPKEIWEEGYSSGEIKLLGKSMDRRTLENKAEQLTKVWRGQPEIRSSDPEFNWLKSWDKEDDDEVTKKSNIEIGQSLLKKWEELSKKFKGK